MFKDIANSLYDTYSVDSIVVIKESDLFFFKNTYIKDRV